MTKAIDEILKETWSGGIGDEPDIMNGNGVYGMFDSSLEDEGIEEDIIRARIASVAPEALRLLLELECVEMHGSRCPFCSTTQFRRGQVDDELVHKDGCEWLALMQKAGLR